MRFSPCSGFSEKKNGAKKNPPRIPVAFCDAPFLPESPYALSAAYGLNVSLRARVFFIFSAKKKMQNAEPVKCLETRLASKF